MEAGTYGRTTGARRLSTETKQAFKTTEFVAYVVVLIALLIAGMVADGSDNVGASDGGFGAEDVWLYATLLTIGYMISRGLAKAGSRDPYTESTDTGHGDGLTDRVRAAAQVIKDGPESGTGEHRYESETHTRRL